MSIRNSIFFIQLFLLASCGNYYVKETQRSAHQELKGREGDVKTNGLIAPYKYRVDSATSRVLAVSKAALTKDGDETTLGNFVCDAMRFGGAIGFPEKHTDVVLMNRGGLRVNLPEGDIRVINIFELMPFENELVRLEIKGHVLMEMLPLLRDKKHPFFGMKLVTGQNEVKEFTIGGTAIDTGRVYAVLTSDYLASGGDNFTFLKRAEKIERCNLKIRDCIIRYCEYFHYSHLKIEPYRDGRIEVSK